MSHTHSALSSTPFMHEEDAFFSLPTGESMCYRSYGNPNHPTVMLVVGLTLQLHYWPKELVMPLIQAGYRVVVLDNRDIGRSFRHPSPPLGMKQILFAKPHATTYTLTDMANDAVALMDHLGIAQAHVAGMSMGGMIAQEMACIHQARVLSLTSIFSTTGNRKVGQPSLGGKLKILGKPPTTRDEAIAAYLDKARYIAGKRYTVETDWAVDYAGKAWDRLEGKRAGAGISRQIGAILKSGDRTAKLKQVTVPTLVIHGDRDPLVHPSGGHATADAIDGARHLVIPGMGHYISQSVSPLLADLLLSHFSRPS
ncbi:MAG TPA: alpha/beta fold hydrolase [Limnobacter sp.]|uniref:alpha/beta fold hydrolase n=1 Tax=Limnobacter sp. TaxID=2003368 RepID=UPI002EDA6690